MTSGAFTAAYLELAPRFERATGHTLVTATTSMGVGEASIPSRLQRRDVADVVIIEDAALQELVGVGPHPGRHARAAGAIGHRPRGAGGCAEAGHQLARRSAPRAAAGAVGGVLRERERPLRLHRAVSAPGDRGADGREEPADRSRAGRSGGGARRGRARISADQRAAGGARHRLRGAAAAGRAANVSVFSAGVAAHSRNAGPARALIALLASAEAAPVVARTGLEPFAAQTASVAGAQGAPSGEAVYAKHCAACHDQTAARIPSREALVEDVAGPHPAHARLRADDERGLPAQAPGAGGGGGLSRQGRRRTRAAAERDVQARSGGSWPETMAPAGRGWSPAPDNARFQPRAARGPERRGPVAARVEVGVRIPRRRDRFCRADGAERARCSSAAPPARCRRSTRRPAACTGSSRRTVPCGPR